MSSPAFLYFLLRCGFGDALVSAAAARLSYRHGAKGAAFEKGDRHEYRIPFHSPPYPKYSSRARLAHLLPEIALRGLMDDRNMPELVNAVEGSDLSVRLYPNKLCRQYAHSGTLSLEYNDATC